MQEPLSTPVRRLMGPGPSEVHPRVYRALSTPVIGHLDPAFLQVMDRLQEMLRRVFQTRNPVTLAISGTGSAGMEAALLNLVEPDDEVIIGVKGVFGGRMAEIVERIGGKPVRVEKPWGQTIDPGEVRRALDDHPGARLVAIIHAETSTGAHQPLEEIGRLCRERDKLLLVDAVTSLGGIDLRVDEWGIDACYSGSQKCLSCPPGLAPLTLGERALKKMRSRRTKPPGWYLDVSLIESYWTEGKRAYHHTAPISMNYALHEALAVVLEDGLERRFARHRLHSRALVAGLEALGFRMFAEEGRRLTTLNSVWVPEELARVLPDAQVRKRLLEDYGVEIGGGLGAVAGKIWRIGLMGESSRRENVLYLLAALESILLDQRVRPRAGEGIEAAAAVYREAGAGEGRPAEPSARSPR